MNIEKKTRRVQFRMTPSEYGAVKAKADQAGMSISRYLYLCAADKEITVIDTKAIKDFLFQLNAIGVNLNQLTILSHQGKITAPQLGEVMLAQDMIYKMLSDLLQQTVR